MKTYSFKVVVEPDEDADGNPAWHAYCPALEKQGAATSGRTREEALKHINEVVQLVVESMIEHDEALPAESAEDVQVTVEPRVTVNV
jgi:predicted RNase H-like HicB family nuclease